MELGPVDPDKKPRRRSTLRRPADACRTPEAGDRRWSRDRIAVHLRGASPGRGRTDDALPGLRRLASADRQAGCHRLSRSAMMPPCRGCRLTLLGRALEAGVVAAVVSEMPRKVRELLQELTKAGFVDRRGKGSHRRFKHPKGAKVTVSGNQGDDARAYQERDVARAIKESQR